LLKQKKIRTNKVNGKTYIGSSVDLGRRFSEYFRDSYLKKKDNMAIYKAINKYGHSNFSLEIFEYCERGKVRAREQYYLNNLPPEYNILPIAGSSLGCHRSEETKAKIGEASRKA
jgi:group I intron endonuclease